MSYQSGYTGDQMESVFKRVTDMITGTLVITASIDGHGYGYVHDLAFGGANPKVFAAVRGLDSAIADVAGVAPSYNAESDLLLLQLFGAGIVGGQRYAVDYLIVE